MVARFERPGKALLAYLLNRFRWWWRYCERQGLCDGLGGAEYRRVKGAWQASCYPMPLFTFIRSQANAAPQAPAP